MKAAKWRDLSDDELTQKAQELSEELFNLRFQLSMGVAKNPSRVGEASATGGRSPRARRIQTRWLAASADPGRRAGAAKAAVRPRKPAASRSRGRRRGRPWASEDAEGVVSDKMTEDAGGADRAGLPPSPLPARHPAREEAQGPRRDQRQPVGDRVLIEETRPLSKDKRWRIREILARVA